MDNIFSSLPSVPVTPIIVIHDFSKTNNRLKKYLNTFYYISPNEWVNTEKLIHRVLLLKNNIKNPLKSDNLHWKISEINAWEKYYFGIIHYNVDS